MSVVPDDLCLYIIKFAVLDLDLFLQLIYSGLSFEIVICYIDLKQSVLYIGSRSFERSYRLILIDLVIDISRYLLHIFFAFVATHSHDLICDQDLDNFFLRHDKTPYLIKSVS